MQRKRLKQEGEKGRQYQLKKKYEEDVKKMRKPTNPKKKRK